MFHSPILVVMWSNVFAFIADPIAEGFDYSWLNDVEWLDERGFILHAETKRPLRILDGIGPDNGPTRHAAGEFLKYGTVRGSEWWVDV